MPRIRPTTHAAVPRTMPGIYADDAPSRDSAKEIGHEHEQRPGERDDDAERRGKTEERRGRPRALERAADRDHGRRRAGEEQEGAQDAHALRPSTLRRAKTVEA